MYVQFCKSMNSELIESRIKTHFRKFGVVFSSPRITRGGLNGDCYHRHKRRFQKTAVRFHPCYLSLGRVNNH